MAIKKFTQQTIDSTVSLYPGRNLIYNGAMQVHQRGTSTTGITGQGYVNLDRWQNNVQSMGTWTQTVENDAPTGSGFRKSMKILCTTADSTPAAGDVIAFRQLLEGQDLQRIKKGTSAAEQLTVSFWVKSNVTGTYVAELQDNDNTRQVSAAYTISASGTWEKKTITFPADTTGAFDNDNAASLTVQFFLGAGSNFTSGTLQTTWASTVTANRAVGQTNLAAATNNYWQITGVQLEVGNTATPFEFEDIGTTLAKCQRYYQRISASSSNAFVMVASSAQTISTTQAIGWTPLRTTMRALPSAIEYGGTFVVSATGSVQTVTAIGIQDRYSTDFMSITYTVASGLTGSQFATIHADNSTSAFLAISAEL